MPSTTTFRSGTDFHAFAQDGASAPASAPPKPLALLGRLDFALREQIAGEMAFCRDFAIVTAARVARLRPSPAALPAETLKSDLEGDWSDHLQREYAENFMPARPEQSRAVGAAEKTAGKPHLAGVLALGAMHMLWRGAKMLQPLARLIFAWRGLLFKAAAVGLMVLAGADMLAKWPDSPKAAAKPAPAAPRDAWIDIAKPYQLYELSAPLLAHEKHNYSARRHAAGGGREDIVTFGQFAAERNKPFVRLSVYRHGQEKIDDGSFFVEMARRAAPLGLSVAAVRQEPAHPSRFGDFETAALTLSEGKASRDQCRGFRLVRAQPGLTLTGLACAAEDDSTTPPSMTAQDVACLLNRLDLLAAGADRPLRDFFGAAESRNVRGCNETGRRR